MSFSYYLSWCIRFRLLSVTSSARSFPNIQNPKVYYNTYNVFRHVPGSLVVRIPRSHRGGRGSIPRLGISVFRKGIRSNVQLHLYFLMFITIWLRISKQYAPAIMCPRQYSGKYPRLSRGRPGFDSLPGRTFQLLIFYLFIIIIILVFCVRETNWNFSSYSYLFI